MPTDDPKPVDTIDFWKERVFRTIATGGMLHQIIWDEQYELWEWMQSEYRNIMKSLVSPKSSVLDAGCGYGALVDCFRRAGLDVDYTGIDFSPDLITLAKYRYPGYRFACIDLYDLPYEDNRFDWVIVRSVSGMLDDHLGPEAWPPMHKELLRVGKQLFIGGYPQVIDGVVEYKVHYTVEQSS